MKMRYKRSRRGFYANKKERGTPTKVSKPKLKKAETESHLKYRCKICGEIVEFRTEHLMKKHPEVKFPQMLITLLENFEPIIRKTDQPTIHEEKLEVANEIIQILKRKGYKAKLVGSVAKGTDTPYSDVDILVDAPVERYHDIMTDKDIVKCLRKHPNVRVDFMLV